MNPEADKILSLSMQKLMSEITPLLASGFAQSQLGLLGFMLTLAGNEYERGADLRAKENASIRQLLAASAPHVKDTDLQSRLVAAASARDDSLKISALNKANWALRRALIELHGHVEQLSGENARAVERNIWVLLRLIAQERMVKLGPS